MNESENLNTEISGSQNTTLTVSEKQIPPCKVVVCKNAIRYYYADGSYSYNKFDYFVRWIAKICNDRQKDPNLYKREYWLGSAKGE